MLGTSVSDLDQGAGKNITNGKYYKRAFVNWKNGTLFKIAPFRIKLRDTILSDPPFFNNSAVVIKKLKFQGR